MKKPSILIVDDEESIRVSLEGILKKNITLILLKIV
jgi:hypothetical protein